MTIYSRSSTSATFYRRLYELAYGPIPKDENNRSYEIHHLDGNRTNNDISNLIAVSIADHYEIHSKQGDWAACLTMAERMKLSPVEISELASKNAKKQVSEGKHPWQNKEKQREKALKQVSEGKHPWQGSEKTREKNLKRVAAGTHNWLGGDATRKQIASGTHTSQIIKQCEYCGKCYSSAMYSRWHGLKCKHKDE